MSKKMWALMSATAVSVMTVSLMGTTAMAATDTFSDEYQAKAAQEASLWQQVQSSGVTSDTIQALENTVTNINTQTTTLYSAWQALNAGVSSIPKVDTDTSSQLKLLQGRRQEIINANNKAWSDVEFDLKHHQLAALQHDMQQHTYWSHQLSEVNAQIKALEQKSDTLDAPYMGARTSLATSMLHLEDAAIFYTREIIELQGQGDGSTTGSTYTPDTSNTDVSIGNTASVTY